MADAQKEAKEKRQNTYTDYDVHEVICSPKSCIQLNESPESCLAINTGTDTIEASLFCASGETKKYTIRKLNTKRKIFLVKSGYSQGVIKAKGKQPIDVDALSNIVCSEPKASETTALDIARSLLEFLGVTKKGWIDECIKNKSDKYCHSEWARRNPQPKASHGGGGRS